MSASGVKSKPSYAALRADLGGRYHLLLGAAAGGACLLRVLHELRAADPASWHRTRVLMSPAAADPSLAAFRQAGFDGVLSFDDSAALIEHARSILERSLMGTRLYVAGPESFIGRVLQIAAAFNLNKDEVQAEHSGTLARRVRCVHCRSGIEDVRTNIVRCPGCARWLGVRDHYSRRFAAYMGVMADAEVPGELPPMREIYT